MNRILQLLISPTPTWAVKFAAPKILLLERFSQSWTFCVSEKRSDMWRL